MSRDCWHPLPKNSRRHEYGHEPCPHPLGLATHLLMAVFRTARSSSSWSLQLPVGLVICAEKEFLGWCILAGRSANYAGSPKTGEWRKD
eukprot:5800379-Pyramimonas_sp.AAC.1